MLLCDPIEPPKVDPAKIEEAVTLTTEVLGEMQSGALSVADKEALGAKVLRQLDMEHYKECLKRSYLDGAGPGLQEALHLLVLGDHCLMVNGHCIVHLIFRGEDILLECCSGSVRPKGPRFWDQMEGGCHLLSTALLGQVLLPGFLDAGLGVQDVACLNFIALAAPGWKTFWPSVLSSSCLRWGRSLRLARASIKGWIWGVGHNLVPQLDAE